MRGLRLLISVNPEIPVPPVYYGGIERMADALVRGLRRRGHVVGLIANGDSSVEADAKWAWPGQTTFGRLDTLRNMRALTRAVRRFRPDLIHSFARNLFLLPVLPRRIPKLASYQSHPEAPTVARLIRLS